MRTSAALLALLLLGACASPGPAPRGTVEWLPWEPATFERARAGDRLLLVGVEAVWCHWCHVMDEETYADPEVAALIRDHFVPVRVDADARPDIAERYAAWGWPATAILTPDAQPITERRGFQPPRKFADLLRGLAEDHRAGKPLARPPEAPPPAHAGPLEEARVLAEEVLDSFYDADRAGWGRGVQKYPLSAPVEHAFLRARLRGETEWARRALDTLRAEANLVDPVWGGMYQYSEGGGWTSPHYEKIAAVQAGALENFVEAYRATGDPEWLRLAREIERYLLQFLLAPEGGFYASQDADLRPDDGGEAVEGRRYFALDDSGRRALGIPRIDPGIYTDFNGMIAAALFRLAEATGDPRTFEVARGVLRRSGFSYRFDGGGFRHAAGDRASVLHLADQVEHARACLLSYDSRSPFDDLRDPVLPVTLDPAGPGRSLRLADLRRRAEFLLDHFEDRENGGFFAHTEDPSATGVFAERRKPFEGNARAARFLIGLWRRTGEEKWKDAALRALRAFSAPETIRAQERFTGDFLLALEEAEAPRVRFTVVGSEGKPARDLWYAALRVYDPLKVMESEPVGGRYGDPGRPAVFVCDDAACSAPIFDAEGLARFARRPLEPALR